LEALHGNGIKEPVLDLILGTAYLGKNDPVKAGASIQEYLEKNPEDSRAKHLYGLALNAQGKRAEAVNYFEDALNASPPIMESLGQLVTIDIAGKDLDSALKRITRQIESNPSNGELYQLLGRVHLLRKELEQAEAACLKAIEIQPKLVQAHTDLAQVYFVTKRTDLATARLDEVIKLDSRNVGALMLSGIIYQQRNDINKAREAYEAALAINPSFVSAANNLAYIYSEYLGETDKALKLAKAAKDGAPEDPNISDTLGWALYKRGNYDWALTYLQESASKLPDNTEVQFHLGMTYYQLGNLGSAKEALTKALASGTEFRGAADAKRVLSEIPE
jgi:tetratricopeptide (TPR) repeat protein